MIKAVWTGWSCVSGPNELVGFLVDRGEEVSYRTFAKYVDLKSADFLEPWQRRSLSRDYSVTFLRTELPSGDEAWVLQHSGIEYAFVGLGVDFDAAPDEAVCLVEALDDKGWPGEWTREEIDEVLGRKKNPYTALPKFLSSVSAAVRYLKKNVDVEGHYGDDEIDDEEIEAELASIASEYVDFAEDAYSAGAVRIWRAVTVPSVDSIELDNLGKYWSKERSGARTQGSVPYKAPRSHLMEVVIEGVVLPQHIDWEHGFESFFYYGEDQWEVALDSDAPVLIYAIGRERFDPPLEGNSGEAATMWR